MNAETEKCLEALSKDREWRRCSCDVSWQVVPYYGVRRCEWATSDCRSTDDGCMQAIRAVVVVTACLWCEWSKTALKCITT